MASTSLKRFFSAVSEPLASADEDGGFGGNDTTTTPATFTVPGTTTTTASGTTTTTAVTVEEVTTAAVLCTSCGSVFLADSVYCRKCGARRPYDTKRRYKGANKELLDKLMQVAKACRGAEGFDHGALDMLGNGTKDSLGPKKDDRDEFQIETAKMIGIVLEDIKRRKLELITALKAKVEAAKAVLVAKERARDAAQEIHNAARKMVADAANNLNEKQRICEQCRDAVRAAEKVVKDAQEALNVLLRKKQRWLDIYNLHFLPLRDSTDSNDQAHMAVLLPLLENEWGAKWGYEECLMGAFKPAVKHKKDKRCKWCGKAFEGVEENFHGPLDDLEEQIHAAQDALDKANAVLVKEREKCHEACNVEVPKAQDQLNAAKKDEADAREALRAAEKEVQDAQQVLQVAERELRAAEFDYDQFEKGPLAAYFWLLEQQIGDYNDDSLLPIELTKTFAAPVPDKMQSVTRGIVDSTVSLPCKEMLKNMGHHSLGPPKKGRDPMQDQANTMIEKVLQAVLTELQKLIDEASDKLTHAKMEEETAHKQRDIKHGLYTEAKDRLDGKKTDLKDAQDRCKRALEAVRRAKVDEDGSQKVVEDFTQLKLAWEDAYKTHFVPLTKGEGNWESHHNALMPLFKRWGKPYNFEDCLLTGFKSAAKAASDKPQAGCEWCDKILAEIDRLWVFPVKDLEDKLAAATMELNEKKAQHTECKSAKETVCDKEVPQLTTDVREAEAAMATATAELSIGEKEWKRTTTILKTAEESLQRCNDTYKNFQDGPWKAFVYLKEHDHPKL